jgi:hypothetical protein
VRAGGVRHTVEKISTRASSCFKPCPDRRSKREVIVAQSCESPNPGSFETSLREFWDKKSFGCSLHGKVQNMGEGGGFPRVRAVLNLVSPKLPVACPSTKGAPTQY